MSTWKPGDVAMVTWGVRPPRREVMFRTSNGGWENRAHYFADGDDYLHDARPLVVIDPEDADQVGKLALAYDRQLKERFPDEYSTWPEVSPDEDNALMQAALREFARPPIGEPTGLGAVVQDRDGDMWTRRRSGNWEDLSGPPGDCRRWANLSEHYAPLRVLSPGIEELGR